MYQDNIIIGFSLISPELVSLSYCCVFNIEAAFSKAIDLITIPLHYTVYYFLLDFIENVLMSCLIIVLTFRIIYESPS